MKKIYLIAAILALFTLISVYSFAGSLEKSSKRDYTEVVTAAINITERTVLTEDMLIIKTIPTEAVTPNAITNITQAVGLFTDKMIEQGEILSYVKLHKQGEKDNGLTYFVPQGKRALTIEVDVVSGVGGFILPGNKVDILSVMVLDKKDETGIIKVPMSLIILQNIEVLAAGSSITVAADGKSIPYSTITLALTPEEALTINLASSSGKLRLILRSPLDNDIMDIEPKTLELKGNTLG